MPVSPHTFDDARRTLESLAIKFRAMASEYPTLRSVVVTCSDNASRYLADCVASEVLSDRQVRRLYGPSHVVHWLIDDDPKRGRLAFDTAWSVARLAVECLAEAGILHLLDTPPSETDDWYHEGVKCYFVGEWTWFVHRLPKTPRPGSLLRSYPTPSVEHFPLKDGATCWTLSVPLFEASASLSSKS